jgi:type IV pilus assembly protein PilM
VNVLFGKQHMLHLIFADRYFRFLLLDKNRKIIKFGQKCLPVGTINDGMIEDEQSLYMIVEQTLEDHKIKKLPTSLCIPNGHTILRTVSIPPDIPNDELKGYLYMSVGESLHLPFADPIIEWVEKNDDSAQREVLVIASRESVVQQYVLFLERMKLKPMVMDLSILSLYRLFYHLDLISQDDHVLMVQIDYDSIQLSLFHKHQPVYVHHSLLIGELEESVLRLQSGYECFDISIDTFVFEDQLQMAIQEIERLQNFYRFNLNNGSQEISKLLISGDHPYLEKFVKRIKRDISQPVIALTEPLFQTKNNVNIPHDFTECIGLSLK